MVKSRRAASSFQSSVNATVARRPSVETSRRRVVISDGWPSLTAVIVPCSMPVGTALILRRLQPRHDLVRREPCREIDVADGSAEQFVAHRAADVAGQAFVRAERVEQRARCRGCSRHRCGVELHAPLQPARQIDDHCRGRPPDPAAVPDDLVIVALAALEQGAAAAAGWRDRAGRRAALRTSRPLHARAGRAAGPAESTPTTGVTTIAGDGPIGFDRADHLDCGGVEQDFLLRLAQAPRATASSPGSMRPPGKATWPAWVRRCRGGRSGSRPGSARSVIAISTAAGVPALGDHARSCRRPAARRRGGRRERESRRRSASVIQPAPAGKRRRRSTRPAGRCPRPARARQARNRPAASVRPRGRGGRPGGARGRARSRPARSGWSGPRISASPLSRRKAMPPLAPVAFAGHLDRPEGGGLDLDLELLDRGHQHVAAVGLAPQDGREQAHHRRPADRRAVMIPGAVAGDAHPRMAAALGIPAGRPAAGGARRSAAAARRG